MKNMRKLLSLLLVAVMVMGLSVSAMAFDVTIRNTDMPEGGTQNASYTAYKIFDATYPDGTNLSNAEKDGKVSYSISTDSQFFWFIRALNDTKKWFTFTLRAGGTETNGIYDVKATNAFNDAAAAELANELNGMQGISGGIASNGNVITIPDGQEGYYFIADQLGNALIVKTLGNVTIEHKNAYPTITKKIVSGNDLVDEIDAERGEVVTIEVTVNVPSTVNNSITVHDAMAGMTYVKGSLKNVSCSHVLASNVGENNRSVDFVVASNTGRENKFQYQVKLDANASVSPVVEGANPNTNSAYLTYGGYTSAPVSVEVKTYKLDVKKVDGTNNNADLPGAEFVLMKNTSGDDENPTYVYYQATDAGVQWVEQATDATKLTSTTENSCLMSFEGLKNGRYTIRETKAPDGYNPASDKHFNITNASLTGVNQVIVQNFSGTELPSTGGIGTTIFYVIGGVLVLGAGVVLVSKKRMSTGE